MHTAADLIWRCYSEYADVEIPDDKYGPRGTPKKTDLASTRNVYTELRDALILRGMPREEIAFMHDHDAPRKKTELMDACRDGRVRVLITSTKKGGTGLNAQRALKQLVNMDPSWTAADMEQRIGRIIRQGNVFDTVDVVNLVARRSYDAMMYQYVARKAAFVQQIRRHDVPATMEDVGGDFAASWAQTKAAATGDPVFVQQVEADQLVTALEARRDVVTNNNLARTASIKALTNSIRKAQEALPILRATGDALNAWSNLEDRRRKLWSFPDGHTVADDKSGDLVDAVRRRLTQIDPEITRSRQQLVLVELAGVPVTVEYFQTTATYEIEIAGIARHLGRDGMIDVKSMDSAARGFIQQIRNSAAAVPDRVDAVQQRLNRERERLATVEAEPELVFEDGAALETARLRAGELRLEVNSRENSPEALKRQRLDTERRRALGQYPKWSLDLAPTEAWADKHGTDRAGLTASVPTRMKIAAREWADGAEAREQQRRDNVWKPVDATESEWRYGYDRNTGMPGARVWWASRQWQWEAWNGTDQHHTGITDRRPDAWAESRHHVTRYADDRNISPTDIVTVSAARPYPGDRDAVGAVMGSAIARARATDTGPAGSESRQLPRPLSAGYGTTTETEPCNEP